MTNRITEEVIQAYESILEQSKLELYFRHNLAPNNNEEEEEEEDAQEEEEEEVQEEDAQEGERSETGQSNQLEEDDTGWSKNELDLFFISLERRSKLRCDLIAEDLRGCKSINQITHLIHLFEQEKRDQKERNPLRRIKDTPIAIEVSKEWDQIEKVIASRLIDWEETKYQKLGDKVDSNAECDWDTQILYSVIFLRKSIDLDPLQNEANLFLKQSSSSSEEVKIFSSTNQDVVEALHDARFPNKLDFLSFRAFSKDHCVPIIDSDLKAWDVVLRCIQLGYLVPLQAKRGKKKAGGEFRASLDEQPDLVSHATIDTLQKSPEQTLVWWDSIPNTKDLEELTRSLDGARELALHQLLRSLRWKELRQIMKMIYHKTANEETEQNVGRKRQLTEIDANEDNSSKRRKITTGEAGVKTDSDTWSKRKSRFERIGIDEDALLDFLKPPKFEDYSLFDANVLKMLFNNSKKFSELKFGLTEEKVSSLGENISIHTIDILAVCLRLFLDRILDHIAKQISHSLRPDAKQTVVEITDDDIWNSVAIVKPIISKIDPSELGDSNSESDKDSDKVSDANKDLNDLRLELLDRIHDLDLEVFDSELLDGKHDFTLSANVHGLIDENEEEEEDEEGTNAYNKRVRNHFLGLKSSVTPLPSNNTTRRSRKAKQSNRSQSAKEAQDELRWQIIYEEDEERSKMDEEILWHQLGLKVPDTLSYNGEGDYQATDEDQATDESSPIAESDSNESNSIPESEEEEENEDETSFSKSD